MVLVVGLQTSAKALEQALQSEESSAKALARESAHLQALDALVLHSCCVALQFLMC